MKKYDIEDAVSMLEKMTREQRHEAVNYIRYLSGYPEGNTLQKSEIYWWVCWVIAFILILTTRF